MSEPQSEATSKRRLCCDAGVTGMGWVVMGHMAKCGSAGTLGRGTARALPFWIPSNLANSLEMSIVNLLIHFLGYGLQWAII